jgi:hypothetical protein
MMILIHDAGEIAAVETKRSTFRIVRMGGSGTDVEFSYGDLKALATAVNEVTDSKGYRAWIRRGSKEEAS